MYHLATIHFVTDRRTDRDRQYDSNSQSCCLEQYDWLKAVIINYKSCCSSYRDGNHGNTSWQDSQ